MWPGSRVEGVSPVSKSDPPRVPRSMGQLRETARRDVVHHLQEVFESRTAVALGYCWHANVGDSMISVAEDHLCDNAGIHCEARVPADRPPWSKVVDSYRESGVLLHGGGNIGDLYPIEMDARISVLEQFPERPVLQMPQSIHFGNMMNALPFQRAVAMHPHFRLLVRDSGSLDWAERNLDCETYLVPDVALTLDLHANPHGGLEEVLVIARWDDEARSDRGEPPPGVRTVDWMSEPRARDDWRMALRAIRDRVTLPTRVDDMVLRRLAGYRVERGRALVSSARTIVTDRLHVVILCVLLGIPVVAVDNSYGKVRGVVEAWSLAHVGEVEFARTFIEAVDRAYEMSQRENHESQRR